MMRTAWISLAVAIGMATAVAADDSPPAPPAMAPPKAAGAKTRQWLDLQRSGRASGPSRGLPAEAVLRAQKRFLESFSHPIPEQFEPRDEPIGK